MTKKNTQDDVQLNANKNQTDSVETNKANEQLASSESINAKKNEAKQANTTAQTVSNNQPVVIKKGSNALSLLAILIALGVGGAGYYFGQQQFDDLQQKIANVESHTADQNSVKTDVDLSQEHSQIQQLLGQVQNADSKIAQLESQISNRDQAISALQEQINKMSNTSPSSQSNDWLLSEADFLLNNALRKLMIDNDVETSIALLKVAQEVLEKVTDPRVIDVRTAINNDLKQLLAVNNVDQNAIMQRLSQLANNVDELVSLNTNSDEENQANDKVSDNIDDWKTNLEKSADSFLNHFIRITPRTTETSKALLAPNQDIYLRENIRLRLQIAILAVPRQQNELYKQSLETVAAWVRSYFDTTSEVASNFLKSVDELADQSIYVEVPDKLSSLTILDKMLNKTPQDMQKIEISADKTLTEDNKAAAEEIKNDASKTDEPSSSQPVNTQQ